MKATRDEVYMKEACRLALRAAGRTSPNPMVGAVLVKDGKIVGRGHHQFAGADHAEITALKRAGDRSRGATLYINLEPCSHQGRTPPCTRSLIEAQIKEVVAGMRDPNPLVAGRGFAELRRAGIHVRTGVLEPQCQALNEAFIRYITRRKPFVTLKLAATLDGKIATACGDARWISGVESRRWVHRLRDQVDAVLVGAGTVAADDPQLTCRIERGRDPWRVVLDARLSIPLSARLLHQRHPEKNVIVTSNRASKVKIRQIEALGAQVWVFPASGDRILWSPVLKRLAKAGIVSVLVEGGAATAASALKEKAVDKILFFYAPKIFGGDGRAMLDPLGVRRARGAIRLRRMETQRLGPDLLVSAYL